MMPYVLGTLKICLYVVEGIMTYLLILSRLILITWSEREYPFIRGIQ